MRRLYRALLFLYPRRFREEYGEELWRAFDETARRRSSLGRVAAALSDVIPNAVAAHWDILRHGAAAGTTWPAFGSDIRFAFRQIANAPLVSGVVIAVLALGIGVNAGLLTVLDIFVWQPAPGIARDASLARLLPRATRPNGGESETALSYLEILELRRRRDVFADVAGWTALPLGVDLGAGAESMTTFFPTANLFRVLRVPLAAGAGFPDEADRSYVPVAIIPNSIWMTHFGGSPDAIGKTIRVMNQPFTIVGVAPPLFNGPDIQAFRQAAIWVPLGTRALLAPPDARDVSARRTVAFRTVARLAPGIAPGDVARMTAATARRLAQLEPSRRTRLTIDAVRLTAMRPSGDRTETIAGIALVAALIVVITCTNVSALLLGRAAARRREVSIRLALGATRRRLVRQMLTESLVHALLGAAVALVLYAVVIKIAYATIPDIIYGLTPRLPTFLSAAALALLTTIVFGLAPALHATSADIGEVIKNSGSGSIHRSRMQTLFVVVQLACSQPVLVVTSLVLADLRGAANENAIRAPASVITIASTLTRPELSPTSASRDAQADFHAVESIRDRLERVPGVLTVGLSTEGAGVSTTGEAGRSIVITGQETVTAAGMGPTRLHQRYVSSGYFATLGLPITRGRALTPDDDRAGSTAVVVNEAAAAALWPGENPIRKRLSRQSDDGRQSTPLQVVGVVGLAPYESDETEPTALVYAPFSTASGWWDAKIVVRTSGDARAALPQLRAAVREVEPYAALGNISTLAEQYESQRHEAVESNAAAFAIGAAALVLASLGLYAIIAFAVAQRTREIGVRMAMGASPTRVSREFFANGIRVSTIGLAIGVPATVIGIRVVKASLLGFTIHNVAAVLVVAPVLIAVAALASWLPARRAGRVDPLIALRAE